MIPLSPQIRLLLFFFLCLSLSLSHTHIPTQQHGSADLARNSVAQVDRSRVQRVSTEAADTSACLISPGNWACSIYFSAEMQSGAGSWQGSNEPVIRCSFFFSRSKEELELEKLGGKKKKSIVTVWQLVLKCVSKLVTHTTWIKSKFINCIV